MNTTVNEIDYIDEMLLKLSKERLQEVRDFIGYLLEKEKKRKAFEDRIANIEQESDTVTFDSVEDAMNAIRNWNG
jgi:chorismate mutase